MTDCRTPRRREIEFLTMWEGALDRYEMKLGLAEVELEKLDQREELVVADVLHAHQLRRGLVLRQERLAEDRRHLQVALVHGVLHEVCQAYSPRIDAAMADVVRVRGGTA